MADDARRAAERRWRESGEAADGRRFLAHLVRGGDEVEALRVRLAVGDLHEERALLAAHVGHAPARAALGDRAPADAASTLEVWTERLYDFGLAACVRAALAAGRLAAARFPDSERHARAALDAAEAWLVCPCPRHYAASMSWNDRKGAVPEWAWQTVTATHCPPRSCRHHVEAIRGAADVVGEDAVRAAIREALVPWTLPPKDAERPLERPVSSPS